MFRNILAPVDLSDRHDDAVDRIAELVEPDHGRVTLVHVIETIEGVEFEELADFYRDLEQKAEATLARVREQLEKRDVRCETLVRYGPRAARIVALAEEAGCDLIVLSSHALGPDRPHGGLGTTSHQVALVAGCAVLLVR
jgi:nucleotide-binding universal stress UspA family protein